MRRIGDISATILLVVMAFVVTGCIKPLEPYGGDTPTVPDGCVDLGLPSGILWATCNVGAVSPEQCGDYFSWGETATKEIYDWKNYGYSTFIDGTYKLTKYCTDPSRGFNGFVDSLTVLEPYDDVAAAKLGDDWRMATKEEWEELYQNTTFTWTALDGVEGRLLTGPNGNSIFLPATGFYLDGELICTGLGIYWSSTLQINAQMSAWSLHFDFENCHVCGTYERSRGQCIRAVRK